MLIFILDEENEKISFIIQTLAESNSNYLGLWYRHRTLQWFRPRSSYHRQFERNFFYLRNLCILFTISTAIYPLLAFYATVLPQFT